MGLMREVDYSCAAPSALRELSALDEKLDGTPREAGVLHSNKPTQFRKPRLVETHKLCRTKIKINGFSFYKS